VAVSIAMQLQSAKTEIVIASSPVFVIPKSRKRFFPDRGGGYGIVRTPLSNLKCADYRDVRGDFPLRFEHECAANDTGLGWGQIRAERDGRDETFPDRRLSGRRYSGMEGGCGELIPLVVPHTAEARAAGRTADGDCGGAESDALSLDGCLGGFRAP
jgi:hypothetical protein